MKWLSLVLTYFPVVLQTVTAVEASVQAPGATKKQVAMNIITAAAQAAEKIPEPVVQQIAGLVDMVVASLNTAGVFTKSIPATT
jgi:hypothetical protein